MSSCPFKDSFPRLHPRGQDSRRVTAVGVIIRQRRAIIQVRDIFQVKFGQIDQAVALFSRFRKLSPAYKAGRLHYDMLTDISSPMFTLVVGFMAESQAEWERLNWELLGSAEFPQFPLLAQASHE